MNDAVTAYIALGSNLGDREANIRRALELLATSEGVRLDRVSTLIESDPVLVTEQPRFINGVCSIETTLAPLALLRRLQEIEREVGRRPTYRYGPRIVDLDLLLYGDERIDEPDLQVPHPRLGERAFVLGPLEEIAPDVWEEVKRRAALSL
jgi:2-amino-4-hydroxy-6-hydroxymethyldihydropteridine diphosphokinase